MWGLRFRRVVRLLVIALLAATTPHLVHAQASGPVIPPDLKILDRGWADGAGPSHLLKIGSFLLVVDPRQGEMRRYEAAAPSTPPVRCNIPRDFAPWRSVRSGNAVRLVAEPFGPDGRNGYSLVSRRTMLIDAERVKGMSSASPCGFPIVAYDAKRDAALRLTRAAGNRPGAAVTVRIAARVSARIEPQGGRRAQVFAVREAGRLSGGRTALWWSEIDPYPIGKATVRSRTDPPGFGGRVTASQYVGIFGRSGGGPLGVIRIRNASYGSLSPVGLPDMSGVGKLGFETILADTADGRDGIWILAMDMFDGADDKPFKLLRFPVGSGSAKATILLTKAGASTGDRDDGEVAEEMQPAVGADWRYAPTRAAWFESIRRRLQEQASTSWTLTDEMVRRPCGGLDECQVGADAQGGLGVGEDFGNPVRDKTKDAGARWIRPTQLNGLTAGSEIRGVPYSIGNNQIVGGDPRRDFQVALAADYRTATRPAPRPVGHIREGMKWANRQGNYPLGIDCAALVSRIFGIDWRTTEDLLAATPFGSNDITIAALPKGPARGCPQPVRHFSEIQPGDLLLRPGHVVIFNDIARVGGSRNGSLGVRVFEASSRCGRVCESVYDPTFFDGWWILRVKADGATDADCPKWLEMAAAVEAR